MTGRPPARAGRRLARALFGAVARRRWLHLLLGGALLTPYWLLCMTVVLPLAGATAPFVSAVLQLLAYALALPLVALSGLLAPVRPLSAAAARGLLTPAATPATALAAPTTLADGPARTPAARGRTAAWYTLHLALGGLVSGVTLALPPFALLLIARPFAGALRDPASAWFVPLGPLAPLAPVAGLGCLVALAAGAAGAGALLQRLAPALLGPSSADRLAAAEARTAELAVRNRLARELHDSVGHALSAVTLQAGAARRVLGTDPDFVRAALTAIEETTRRTVGELDTVLGLLREVDDPRGGPSLGALDALLAGAGADVDLSREGDPDRLPAPMSRAGYRIVQEALANAARHAPPGPSPTGRPAVTLRIAVRPDALEIRVENALPPHTPPARPGGGHGLRGVADRARLLGGHSAWGPAGDRWRLTVRLPLGTERRGTVREGTVREAAVREGTVER